jgi:acetyl-CoA acetyltransferase
MWQGRGKVAVVGVGVSEISRQSSHSLGTLVVNSCAAAIRDAGLTPEDVDGVATFPTVGPGNAAQQGVDTVGVSYLIDHLPGMSNVTWFSEASTGLVVSVIIDAVDAIVAGTCEVAVVWRGMSMPRRLSVHADIEGPTEYFAPYNLAGMQAHALAYRRYQWKFGASRAEMATLAINSRHNASLNEMAIFRARELSFEQYMDARMISSPLCLYDCDVPVFGSAAIVLTSAERARDCRRVPAYVIGVGQGAAQQSKLGGPLYPLDDYMLLGGRTAQTVWKTSGLGPADVHVAQLYDGYSPSVWYWLEAAGFCREGEAHQFIQDGRIAIDGQLPVNTFGGSLSEGRLHGMGHVIEAVRQVTHSAGSRQVPGANVCAVFDGSPMLRGAGLIVAGETE